MSSYYICQKSKQCNGKTITTFQWGYSRFIDNHVHIYAPVIFDHEGQYVESLDNLFLNRSFVDKLLAHCKKAKITVQREVRRQFVPNAHCTLNCYLYQIKLDDIEAVQFKLLFADFVAVAK